MNGKTGYIREYLTSLTETLFLVSIVSIEEVIDLLSKARALGRKIFICGNGGSASTASHFTCDLGKGTTGNGSRPFKVIPLTDSVPFITAWANDSDYSQIFSMQLEPLIEERDIVIGISASGNSPNVLRAIETANLHGAITIGITGFDGGLLKKLASHSLHVGSFNMQQVEDTHMILAHLVSSALRDLSPSVEKTHQLTVDVKI